MRLTPHFLLLIQNVMIQYGGSFDEVLGNTVNVQRNWGAIPSDRAKPVGRYCTQFRGTYNSFTRYLIKRSTVLTLWSSKWLTSWEVIFFVTKRRGVLLVLKTNTYLLLLTNWNFINKRRCVLQVLIYNNHLCLKSYF